MPISTEGSGMPTTRLAVRNIHSFLLLLFLLFSLSFCVLNITAKPMCVHYIYHNVFYYYHNVFSNYNNVFINYHNIFITLSDYHNHSKV